MSDPQHGRACRHGTTSVICSRCDAEIEQKFGYATAPAPRAAPSEPDANVATALDDLIGRTEHAQHCFLESGRAQMGDLCDCGLWEDQAAAKAYVHSLAAALAAKERERDKQCELLQAYARNDREQHDEIARLRRQLTTNRGSDAHVLRHGQCAECCTPWPCGWARAHLGEFCAECGALSSLRYDDRAAERERKP